MTKLILLIMATFFGVTTARDILHDLKEDASQYIITVALAFYASWKNVFSAAAHYFGLEIQVPPFLDGDIAVSLIKALINLLSSGVLVPITTLYVTYKFKKWHKKHTNGKD